MFVQIRETSKCKCYTSHQTAAFHSVSATKPLFSISFNSMGEPFFSQGHKQAFYIFGSPKHVQTTTEFICKGCKLSQQITEPGCKDLGKNSSKIIIFFFFSLLFPILFPFLFPLPFPFPSPFSFSFSFPYPFPFHSPFPSFKNRIFLAHLQQVLVLFDFLLLRKLWVVSNVTGINCPNNQGKKQSKNTMTPWMEDTALSALFVLLIQATFASYYCKIGRENYSQNKLDLISLGNLLISRINLLPTQLWNLKLRIKIKELMRRL